MKLYSFHYSPYVRKVQAVLDLLDLPCSTVEVPYSDRNELAALTGGYIHVPVLVDDAGKVICDSRRICEDLLSDDKAARVLTPAPLEGPIWAYSDWCDGPLEDVVFRIGSPAVRDHWKSAGDRALYVFIKERKFGAGCVDLWLRQRDELVARAQAMLAPTERTLAVQPFLFGGAPTLADAALYGQFAMLQAGDPALLRHFSPVIAAWIARVEKHAPRPMRVRLAA